MPGYTDRGMTARQVAKQALGPAPEHFDPEKIQIGLEQLKAATPEQVAPLIERCKQSGGSKSEDVRVRMMAHILRLGGYAL